MSDITLQQIVAAPFGDKNGNTYSVIGLSTDGKVYRYDPKCEGWIPWNMAVANCRLQHKGKR